MFKLHTYCISVLILISFSCTKPPEEVEPRGTLYEDIESYLNDYSIKGASICVIDEGEIVFLKSYGYRNSNDQTNNQTMFQAASISKLISALRVLQLAEGGLINLDSDINNYMNNWSLSTSMGIPTAKLLLSHSSGVNVHGFSGYSNANQTLTTLQVLNGEGNSPAVEIIYSPGTTYQYSGGAYTVLQKAIEDITNNDIVSDLDNNLLIPMGMNHSSFGEPSATSNISSGHLSDGTQVPSNGYNYYPEKCAAGLWTTAEDLGIAAMDLIKSLNDTGYDGYLEEQSILNMFEKQAGDHGLGPVIAGENQGIEFSHSGQNYGFSSYFYCKPYSKKAYIIMTNSDNGWDAISLIDGRIREEINWN